MPEFAVAIFPPATCRSRLCVGIIRSKCAACARQCGAAFNVAASAMLAFADGAALTGTGPGFALIWLVR